MHLKYISSQRFSDVFRAHRNKALAYTGLRQSISALCVKSVHIRSFSGPYFPTFGLNTERYSVSLSIQIECGKIRTRKTPNTDTFHALAMIADNIAMGAKSASSYTIIFMVMFEE